MDNYIVSARKYRPMTFASVVGQKALTTTLQSAVKTGKLAHAYLFCGPRGVGKTTCARIFAKAINCMSPTAEGEACNECESCRAFNEQRSYNIFELDAASNNTVENIKTLMDQTRIPPQVGRYKVFIIDEVHMLSTQAFNAFLKTLEEPPSYVVFILATTEKHKLLPTIISRCQIYDFERMTISGTVDHLKMVAEREGIEYEEEALTLIAEKADGGMRDALSIFDQAASFCQGKITLEKVMDDLNTPDADNYFQFVDLALANKVPDMLLLLNSLINRGFDGGLIINSLATHCRNVMMAKDESTIALMECSKQQAERFKQQANKCQTKFLYKALQLMGECDIHYRQSSNKRLLVELTLIEIAQILQDDDTPVAGRSPKRLKTLFRQLLQQQQTKATPQVVVAVTTAHVAPKTAPMPTTTPTPVRRRSIHSLGPSFKMIHAETAKAVEQEEAETSVEGSAATPITEERLCTVWRNMCQRMPDNYKAQASRLVTMRPNLIDGNRIEVEVDNPILFSQLVSITRRIKSTLAHDLNNATVDFQFIQAEQKKPQPKMSRREVFEHLCKENEGLAFMVKELGLTLE